MLVLKIIGENEIYQTFQKLDKALDSRAILDEGAAVIFNNIRTRFLMEENSQGVKWPVSKAAEERARTQRGGGTLFDTGRLFRSLQLFATDAETRAIGTNATSDKGFPYPVVHQFGLAGNPVREFLGFSEDDQLVMSKVIIERVKQALV